MSVNESAEALWTERERMGGAKRYPSISSYGDDGFRRLNPSYILPLQQGLIEDRGNRRD